MSTLLKTLISLVVVLPIAAFVAAQLVVASDDSPSRERIVIEDDPLPVDQGDAEPAPAEVPEPRQESVVVDDADDDGRQDDDADGDDGDDDGGRDDGDRDDGDRDDDDDGQDFDDTDDTGDDGLDDTGDDDD